MSDIAPSDWIAALGIARTIPDGWYRAQALATVAECAPDRHVLDLLKEAVAAANTCHDAYGMVAVLSWPLQIAFRRGQADFAERERERAIALAPDIEPLASRAFALQCLWGACYISAPEHAEPVWRAILALCPPDRSWRAARLYRHVAEVLDARNPGSAIKVIRAMPDGPAREKLVRRFSVR